MKKLLSAIGITGALGVGALALNAVGPASAGSLGVATTSATAPATACATGPKDVLDGLVQKGTITQDQEDAIVQAFKDARSAREPRQPRGPRARALAGAVQVAADTIGVSVDDLKTAHAGAQSIADVATAHRVDPATVVQAIVDAGSAKIDSAVTGGELTEERGDTMKARLAQVADRIVNNTKPDC